MKYCMLTLSASAFLVCSGTTVAKSVVNAEYQNKPIQLAANNYRVNRNHVRIKTGDDQYTHIRIYRHKGASPSVVIHQGYGPRRPNYNNRRYYRPPQHYNGHYHGDFADQLLWSFVPALLSAIAYENGRPMYHCRGYHRGRWHQGQAFRGGPCYIRYQGNRYPLYDRWGYVRY